MTSRESTRVGEARHSRLLRPAAFIVLALIVIAAIIAMAIHSENPPVQWDLGPKK